MVNLRQALSWVFVFNTNRSIPPMHSIKTADDLKRAMSKTKPYSKERKDLLKHGIQSGIIEIKHGANMSVVGPTHDPHNVNDSTCIVHVARLNKDGDAEGYGAFGGGGDDGEHPIVTMLREKLEEFIDVGKIQLNGQDRQDFIQEKIDGFVTANEGTGIESGTMDPDVIRQTLAEIKDGGNTLFKVNEDITLDLNKLNFVPFDEAKDYTYHLGLEQGHPFFTDPDISWRITKPFQFVYEADENEVQAFITDDVNDLQFILDGSEVQRIVERSLGEILETSLYKNPEEDTRYVHEALVAGWVSVQRGGDAVENVSLLPNPQLQAELVGLQNENSIVEWFERPVTGPVASDLKRVRHHDR